MKELFRLKFTTPPPESIQYSSETVIYLGMFFPVWGHVITDNICRIWFLTSDIFKQEFKNYPKVYVYDEVFPKADNKNFRRLMEILEVDVDRIRPITQPTQFEKIILPDRSFGTGFTQFTSEYRDTMDIIKNFALKNRMPTSNKKIFYFRGKDQVGEERLAEYFKSKGYDIIQPEKLTLDEQLNLLINCESFASIIGSCSHNSVFLRDGTETVFIPRSSNKTAWNYQQMMDEISSSNANYIDSALSIFARGFYGPFCYIISEQLKRFFGDKFNGYEEEDFKTFLQHVKYSTDKGLVINPNAKEYYSEVFTDFMDQLKRRKDLIAVYDLPKDWETFINGYQIHVHNKGWVACVGANQISGFTKDKLDIQAIKINFPGHKVYYSVYYNAEEGWSEEVTSPEMAGTTGKSKSIYGIRILLDEASTKKFDILYRVHTFDGDWTDWAKNGEAIYSHGIKLNAIQIKLEPKTNRI